MLQVRFYPLIGLSLIARCILFFLLCFLLVWHGPRLVIFLWFDWFRFTVHPRARSIAAHGRRGRGNNQPLPPPPLPFCLLFLNPICMLASENGPRLLRASSASSGLVVRRKCASRQKSNTHLPLLPNQSHKTIFFTHPRPPSPFPGPPPPLPAPAPPLLPPLPPHRPRSAPPRRRP